MVFLARGMNSTTTHRWCNVSLPCKRSCLCKKALFQTARSYADRLRPNFWHRLIPSPNVDHGGRYRGILPVRLHSDGPVHSKGVTMVTRVGLTLLHCHRAFCLRVRCCVDYLSEYECGRKVGAVCSLRCTLFCVEAHVLFFAVHRHGSFFGTSNQ